MIEWESHVYKLEGKAKSQLRDELDDSTYELGLFAEDLLFYSGMEGGSLDERDADIALHNEASENPETISDMIKLGMEFKSPDQDLTDKVIPMSAPGLWVDLNDPEKPSDIPPMNRNINLGYLIALSGVSSGMLHLAGQMERTVWGFAITQSENEIKPHLTPVLATMDGTVFTYPKPNPQPNTLDTAYVNL